MLRERRHLNNKRMNSVSKFIDLILISIVDDVSSFSKYSKYCESRV
jgi:hypothetical protein